MAHFGTLRNFRFNSDVDDIRGSEIYGIGDEKLGTIDDVIFDHASGNMQYAVVDTGGWLNSRKFMVPADRIADRPGHDNDFFVNMRREQIEHLPAYDENIVEDNDRFKDYESRHREHWTDGPVMHKEGSTHILTPEPDEMPAASGSGDMDADLTPNRIADPMSTASPDSSKLRMRPGGTASRAEDTKRPGSAHVTERVGWEQPEATTDSQQQSDSIRQMDRSDSDVVPIVDRSADIDPDDVPQSNLREFRKSGNVDDIGYGDINATAVPVIPNDSHPPSYRDTLLGQAEDIDDLHRPYPVQQGRNRRFEAFENHLRQNRVDITSSCRSCDPAKDKAA